MVWERESEGRAIRRAIAGLDRGQTTRLPGAVRRRVMDYVRHGRAEGASWEALAQGVGLAVTTLRRWQTEKESVVGRNGARSRAFVPVKLKASEPIRASGEATRLTIRTSSGLEIAGLGLEEVIALVRALG